MLRVILCLLALALLISITGPVQAAADYDFFCNPTNTSINNPVTCIDTSTPEVSVSGWTWYWGDGITNYSVGNTAEHTFTAPGKYFVVLRVVSGKNLTVIRKMGYITVTETPAVPEPIPVLYAVTFTQWTGDTELSNSTFYMPGRPQFYSLVSSGGGPEIARENLSQNATEYRISVRLAELEGNV